MINMELKRTLVCEKYEVFCHAYNNLRTSTTVKPLYDVVTRAGIVGLFKIAYEQAVKMMKEILEYNGYSCSNTGSPGTIIKTEYSAGMINDEQSWISALTARNNVSHSYNEKIAQSKSLNTFVNLSEIL